MAIKIKYPSRRKRTFYLARVTLRLVDSTETDEWNKIVNEYHPLGAPKLPGRQLRYVAEHCGKALAFLSFSACAYHLSSRDQWIGWTREQRSQRKNFVVQNSRFLVMSGEKHPNLASRVLGLCMKRLPEDWEKQFGFRPLIAETFVDGTKFRGSCYKAAGWKRIGNSKGFKRDAQDFYVGGSVPKGIFVKELAPEARETLCREDLPEELRPFETNVPSSLVLDRIGVPRMRSLFSVLQSIRDPRGGQGKKYSLAGCLAIVACGVLAGCTSLRACAELASALSQAQRRTLRFWRNPGSNRFETPDHTTLWRIVSKIDAEELERKVNDWLNKENALPGAIAIDGKVLKATIDNRDSGSCVVSAVPHRDGREPFFFQHIFTDGVCQEIEAAQNLIDAMPDLKGCVLTMDAKHDVKDTFIKIVDKKGDFFICVKNGAATLCRYMNECFEQYEGDLPRAETRNHGHGRIEHRIAEVIPISPAESGWPYTRVACRITRKRKTVRKNIVVNESEETVFYVGSMAADSRSPAEFLRLSRGHWIIENGLHYHKDRSLDEDRNPAGEQKSGRVMCFFRSITALILGKAKEPLNVVKMRMALNLRLLVELLSSNELSQWLKRYQPFTLP